MRKPVMLLRRCVGRPGRLLALALPLLPLFDSGTPLAAAEGESAEAPSSLLPSSGLTPLEEIPTIVPPPPKHQLKTSPVQALEFRVAEQNKYMLKFNFEIRELQETLREQKNRAEAEIRELREANEALKKQAEDLAAQLATLKGQHEQLLNALRNPLRPRTEAPRTTAASSEGEAIPKAVAVNPDGAAVHIVERGDNLISIARRYGTTVGELIRLNKIQDERRLQIGQTLILPAASPKPEAPKPERENP